MSNIRNMLVCIGMSLFLLQPASAAPITLPPPLESLRRQAESFEEKQQWDKAFLLYEQILVKDRTLPQIRERCQTCLRRLLQVRRHRDPSYRQQVVALSLDRAMDFYEEVLTKLKATFVDRARVEPQRLYREGCLELAQALGLDEFCQQYVEPGRLSGVRAFRSLLEQAESERPARTVKDARGRVADAARTAQKALGINPTLIVLEFACGACNALDEYSCYLSPDQLEELHTSLEGHEAGIGLEVAAKDDFLVVSRLSAGGPAEKAGVKRNDRVLRIGSRSARKLTPEGAASLLRGTPGSSVEVDIWSPEDVASRRVKVARQWVNNPSLTGVHLVEEGIGYVQMASFQQGTLQEIDDAVLRLRTDGMRVLILDLRGNSGGLFPVAVKVAERFLASGIIVSTHGPLRVHQKAFMAQNGGRAWEFPLIVLVDRETASAAEVLAGALKENQRGILVGQPTYGKGSIQTILELSSAPSGLRITFARLLSPAGNPYANRGVAPDLLVEKSAVEGAADMASEPQLRVALQEARRLRD